MFSLHVISGNSLTLVFITMENGNSSLVPPRTRSYHNGNGLHGTGIMAGGTQEFHLNVFNFN